MTLLLTYCKKIFIIVAMITLLADSIGFIFFVQSINKPQTIVNDPNINYAVVFTGGTQRLQQAFTLLENNMIQKIFISGVHRGVSLQELLSYYKKSPQKAECCIQLGYDAVNTLGNAKEMIEWLSSNMIQQSYLITSHYHMPRALLSFQYYQKSSPQHHITITPYNVHAIHTSWSSIISDISIFNLILGEYHKYLFAYGLYYML